MIDVICVGILVADILVKPVSGVPDKGLLGLVDSIELFSGGNAMTAALNLSKMGFKSAVAGKIGGDFFGTYLKSLLVENGVNIESLSEDENIQTSASAALSSADGERTFLHCIGANGEFSLSDIDWEVVERSKTVFVTGTFLLDSFDGVPTLKFLKKCKEMGKTTVLDVCWDSRNRWGGVLEVSYPYIDIFLPSISEAEMLSGYPDAAQAADYFIERGVGKVVIKLGKDGAYAKEAGRPGKFFSACGNVKVVDTTGAGDSFCSGFLAAYSKGESFFDCVRFANAAGTMCVMSKGAAGWGRPYCEILEFGKKFLMEEQGC
jgi:sugar/nucleoside kinase (ribokinase family)